MSGKFGDFDQERQFWRRLPRRRPSRIERPGPGQESVWDYPRPPRVEAVTKRVRIEFGGVALADSTRAVRILETASPPVYYVPPTDVRMEFLQPAAGTTLCEWKGLARYWTVRVGERVAQRAAWSYPEPDPNFRGIKDYLAFYPSRMDQCLVGEQRVAAQAGDFYGGWVTPEIVGPFKGEPGTEGW